MKNELIENLKAQMSNAKASIDNAIKNVPEEHREFFDEVKTTINKGDKIDINAFIEKLKNYASRCNSN